MSLWYWLAVIMIFSARFSSLADQFNDTAINPGNSLLNGIKLFCLHATFQFESRIILFADPTKPIFSVKRTPTETARKRVLLFTLANVLSCSTFRSYCSSFTHSNKFKQQFRCFRRWIVVNCNTQLNAVASINIWNSSDTMHYVK